MKQSKILENDTAFRTESTENETNEINFDKPNAANKTSESNFTETENENASKLEVTKSRGQDDTKRNNNQLSSIESYNEASKEDVSTEVFDNSNVMSDQVNVPKSHQEIEAENHNDKGGNRKIASSDIEQSSVMDNKTHANVEEVIHIDHVSEQTKDITATIKPVEIIKSMENNSESKDHVNEYVTDKKSSSNDNEKENMSSSLVMPKDLMSRVFQTTSTSNIPTNICAVCGLWDFAGQKEFYATHQAFLTGSALYLVVADITEDISKQDIKPCFADFQNVGEYVDFWFDTIHCHRTVDPPVGEPINYPIDPPIILVFTGKDKLKKEAEISRTTKKLDHQLDDVFGMQSKYHHLQHICYISNTNDPDEEFEKLRQEISAIAMKMKNWGECVPLKWIL
ncbi:unnamed protein product [Mytilus edulis]|uniref:Uncharacterized protein n=1 Tax=Mytilus edulis TaxID=6550 RepID=A0A8S3UNC1_MYTED|nr:unnamed protein product [Mytilus edulis]